jgi:predicted RNA binding protein YcfA (HicA-like mRNA interferase family)
MTKFDKTLYKVLSGSSDSNIAFSDLCQLLLQLGFKERIKGSHHIFTRNDIEEIINLQPMGSMAKSYQVKQVRNIIIRYKLGDIHGQ